MLTHLHIRHFAIIDDSELELVDGMTALTGETGAGKSILLDALGQVLGERASSLAVQDGAERAEITASFRIDAQATVRDWLVKHELDVQEDCVLRKTLAANGRSRATINGTPVALRMLGELGEQLVGIHGQSAHQTLGQAAEQRRLLDAWTSSRVDVKKKQDASTGTRVQRAHAAWQMAEQACRDALEASTTRSQRLDLLRFQLQEFDELDIGALRIEDIESEHRWLANVERLRELGASTLDALDDTAARGLLQALKPLTELVAIDERLREALDLIESAEIQVSEAASMLRGETSGLEHDETRLAWLDEKLARLHALARKHQCDAEALTGVEQRLRDELDTLGDPGNSIETLEVARDARLDDYLEQARALSRRRKRDAKKLAGIVTDAMQTLAMQGGIFRIDVQADETKRSPHGIDQIAFLVSPNPGVKPAPLGRVASGGELSRIGLAIQLATIGSRSVPTLIFDEVDAGIGGAVAETVGRLLRRVGESTQVLCVTHLPQVAAQAHHHLRVVKAVSKGRTQTRLDALDAKQTRDEIARMLGGATITQRSRQHAKEMLEAARSGPGSAGLPEVVDNEAPPL